MWNSTVSSPLATSRFMTRLVPGGASAPCSSMSLLAASNQPSERNGYLSATKCPPDLLRRGIVCGGFGAGRASGCVRCCCGFRDPSRTHRDSRAESEVEERAASDRDVGVHQLRRLLAPLPIAVRRHF